MPAPKATTPRKTRTPAATTAAQQPDTSHMGKTLSEEEQAMLGRHLKADAASLELRIETMAHALIYDIGCLRDVVTRLHDMSRIEDGHKTLMRFFEYYVPRLEVLLEEEYLLGEISALSDLGEWHMVDDAFGFEFPHYATIINLLKKPLNPTPRQLAMLFERSAKLERDEPSRGESWIPKTSRRASAK